MSEDEDFGPVENELTGKTDYAEGSVQPEKSTVSGPSEEVENQEQMVKESPTEKAEERPMGIEGRLLILKV